MYVSYHFSSAHEFSQYSKNKIHWLSTKHSADAANLWVKLDALKKGKLSVNRQDNCHKWYCMSYHTVILQETNGYKKSFVLNSHVTGECLILS